MLNLDVIENLSSIVGLIFSIYNFVWTYQQHKKVSSLPQADNPLIILVIKNDDSIKMVSRLPQTDGPPVAEDDGLDC